MPIECPFVDANDLLMYIFKKGPVAINLENPMTHAFVFSLHSRGLIEQEVAEPLQVYDLEMPQSHIASADNHDIYRCTAKGRAHLAELDAITQRLQQQQREQERQRAAERAEQEHREAIRRREDRAWRLASLIVPSAISIISVLLSAYLAYFVNANLV